MSFIDPIEPSAVASAEDFSSYVHQLIGTPCNLRDNIVLKKKSKDFFKANPRASWATLCRVARWAKDKRKRPPHAYFLVDWARYAWADGCLPELDADTKDPDVEQQIRAALDGEPDREWRYRLMRATGVDAQREVLGQWQTRKSFISQ
jgi:hypothetical protein